MRRLAGVLVAAVTLGGCTAGNPDTAPTGATGSPAPPTTEPSPTGAPTPTSSPPTRAPELDLPDDAPTVLEPPLDVSALAAEGFLALVPPGAEVTSSSVLATPDDPIDQVTVVWRRGEDAFAAEIGLVVWQAFDGSPAWRAVYAFTHPPRRPVLGIVTETGELTGDGIVDQLAFEDRGGSGGCGTYRAIASEPGAASTIFRRSVCDTEIRIAGGELVIRAAVYEPDDPHCCPSAFRTTALRWDGRGWERISTGLEPTGPS